MKIPASLLSNAKISIRHFACLGLKDKASWWAFYDRIGSARRFPRGLKPATRTEASSICCKGFANLYESKNEVMAPN